jgi:hypothetical protein
MMNLKEMGFWEWIEKKGNYWVFEETLEKQQ